MDTITSPIQNLSIYFFRIHSNTSLYSAPQQMHYLDKYIFLYTRISPYLPQQTNHQLAKQPLILFLSYVSPFTDIEYSTDTITCIPDCLLELYAFHAVFSLKARNAFT